MNLHIGHPGGPTGKEFNRILSTLGINIQVYLTFLSGWYAHTGTAICTTFIGWLLADFNEHGIHFA